jgi:tetratricopeptide (TPR) repeat protein
MKWVKLLVFAWTVMVLPFLGLSQEEESAEIYLEEFTDEFQESFFEALKQKGIENYDKAINALLKCKELDPESHVVDHELAKTYLLNRQVALGQEYAIEALRKQPENPWYLKTYLGMISLQSLDLTILEEQIPFEDRRLKENLALILLEKEQYENTRKLIGKLGENSFTRDILRRMEDSLASKNNKSDPSPVAMEEDEGNAWEKLKQELQDYLNNGDFTALDQGSTQALEVYPLQPFFYYTKGVALNRMSDFKGAEEYLTMGLDFVTEDEGLTDDFYRELGMTYRGLGDPEKANMYLSKVKNGS